VYVTPYGASIYFFETEGRGVLISLKTFALTFLVAVDKDHERRKRMLYQ